MSSEEEEVDLMSVDDEEELMSTDEENDVVEDVFTAAQNIDIRLISQETLLPAQREELSKVMDLLAVKEQLARTLLIHYRWDFARLVDAFVERGNDWLFSQTGVAITLPKSTNSQAGVTDCIVCGDEDLSEEDTTTMNCGHTFCNVCWTKHFLIKINDGQSKRIKCMDPECNVICDEDIIRKLVTAEDPEAAERFDRFLFESYIDHNDKVKWCPSVPHCGNAVRVEGDVYCEIQCTLRTSVLFQLFGSTTLSLLLLHLEALG